MDVAWLESLAVRLRSVLAEHGVAVSQAQALDLVAAVPGLRDWPEAMAFPDRVAACRYDDDAVDRIARRVTGLHAVTVRPEMLTFSLRHMSLFYRSSSSTGATRRLIVTSDASGCGHLKQSRIADQVVVSHAFDSLVSGPVPLGPGPAAFLAAREAAYAQDPSIAHELREWNRADAALRYWSELLALCRRHERIALWIDPDPDAQLRFVQLVDWLGAHPDVIAKLHVVHADAALGERDAEDLRTMHPAIEPVGEAHLRTARAAWHAYRYPTPQAFAALLVDDLDVLPHLRRAVTLLLGELPAADTALVEVVAPGAVKPSRFMHVNAQRNPVRVFGYGEEIRIVERLSRCEQPLIDGLQARSFDLHAHDGPERQRRYMASELTLTTLGRHLLDGNDDFARHNRIHRWWGGTLLTNANLWRWDAARRRLIAPT